jgi:RHS repeat-associated protein
VNNTQYTYLGNLLLEKTQYLNGTKTADTRYVFDGSQATQERDGNNNLVNEYTWGLGLPGGIGGLLQVAQGGNPYSYIYDGKGNVTALLNAAGQPAAAYQYDPFGQPNTLLASVTQPIGFSTKAYDPQTGLSYYGYRFYSPSLGRWLTGTRWRRQVGLICMGLWIGHPWLGQIFTLTPRTTRSCLWTHADY